MIVGRLSMECRFLDGYVPVSIDAKTGRVQADGDIALSKMMELLDKRSMNGVVDLG
jgi:hypothetical protein